MSANGARRASLIGLIRARAGGLRLPWTQSLRGRGVAAILFIAIYIAIGGWSLNAEREYLRTLSLALEQLQDKSTALSRTQNALRHSLIDAKEVMATVGAVSQRADDTALDLELVHSGLLELEKYVPEFAEDAHRVEDMIRQLRSRPASVAPEAVNALGDDLDRRITAIDNMMHAARGEAWQRYHRSYDRMTLIGVMVNLVGVIVFGALVTKFFSRLTWDLQKLKLRAAAIVDGYRGTPLDVSRRDEVGDLMVTVNTMQMELRERERRLEIARQHDNYREKMAAMGSLASAIAHEINNPIAAIAGIAQAMVKAQRSGRGTDARVVVEGPQMILEQAQRISAISRQVAEFTRPPTDKPGMIDVNSIIRSSCKLLQYDRRLRNIDLRLNLDSELRAAFAVADHMTQVLMNLLINAADAVCGLSDRAPTIEIATHGEDDAIVMSVTDNGRGMDAHTLAHAFEEAFSTKPDGDGRGLGLFICQTLLERHGARIELQSTVGSGTKAIIRLPMQGAARSGVS